MIAHYERFPKDFETAFEKIICIEGGYVNNPADVGGETKYGISKRSYPELDIASLTVEEAKDIYYNDFWIKLRNDAFAPGIACKLFDFSINMGISQASKVLQRAIRASGDVYIEDDGVIGIKTITAYSGIDNIDMILSSMRSEGACVYRLIVANNDTQRTFLTGWLRRAYEK